jgi:hypothetical protein
MSRCSARTDEYPASLFEPKQHTLALERHHAGVQALASVVQSGVHTLIPGRHMGVRECLHACVCGPVDVRAYLCLRVH